MFSSPLAECYAREDILGKTPTLPEGYFSKIKDHGNLEYQQHIALPPPQVPTENECRHGSRKDFVDNRAPKSNRKHRQASAPKAFFSNSAKGDKSRPLLSPISFTPPTDAGETSDSMESRKEDQYAGPNHWKISYDAVVAPPIPQDSNRCAFPLCESNPLTAEDGSSRKGAPTKKHGAMPSTKPRALSLGEDLRSGSSKICESYGGPDSSPLRNSLHRTTGSRELRRSAGSLQVNRDCAPWVEQIIRATKRAGSHQPNPPRPGKARLWLDAMGNDAKVAEAQITTVTQSPTKPKVVTIGRRNSSPTPIMDGPSSSERILRLAEQEPATPPESPHSAVGLSISSSAPAVKAPCGQVFNDNRRTQALIPPTPPNSRLATPRPRSTIRRTSDLSHRSPQFDPTQPFGHTTSYNKDTTSRVIAELEAAIYNHPAARLYLDSPVIEHIRQLSIVDPNRRETTERMYTSRRAPHSRYSIFRPLSSHPVARQDVPCYRGIQYQSPEATDRSDHAMISLTTSPPVKYSATFSALRIVFPHAPGALLDSLQATYLALHYVSSLPFPGQSPSCSLRAQCSPAPSTLTFSSIPRKALATLGIQAPAPSPTASTSWFRSGTPDVEVRVTNKDDETVKKKRERLENLQVSLRICVRGLLGEIEGRRLGKRDESLVRAVAEVVRCGQGV